MPTTLWTAYLFLAIAILAEVIATTTLKATDGMTRLWPTLAVIAGYSVAFVCLSMTLRTIPVGIAYAIWAGIGMALIAVLGKVVWNQTLDTPAIIGIALILAGVLVLNLFSSSVKG